MTLDPLRRVLDASAGRDPRFVLISDRTGGARPGVFERGLAVTDLLAPDFAIQLGDLIEGYSHDIGEIDSQWREIDQVIAATRTPVIRVPGNHDVSNAAQALLWRERYGATYFSWRHDDVLFCVLDTQDPPADYADPVLAELEGERARARAPQQAREDLERLHDWNGTQPANLSDAQLELVDDALRSHRDVRWTFLCMHMPLWQGDHPAWRRIRRSLGDRPYSAYAGHVHNYRHQLVNGQSHIRLGPTGGSWVLTRPGRQLRPRHLSHPHRRRTSARQHSSRGRPRPEWPSTEPGRNPLGPDLLRSWSRAGLLTRAYGAARRRVPHRRP